MRQRLARFEEAYTALLFFRPPFSHRFEPPGHKPSDANYREHTRILLHAMLLVGRQATVRFGKGMRLFSLRCLIRSRLQPRAYDSKTGSTQSCYECVTRCLANPALSLSLSLSPREMGSQDTARMSKCLSGPRPAGKLRASEKYRAVQVWRAQEKRAIAPQWASMRHALQAMRPGGRTHCLIGYPNQCNHNHRHCQCWQRATACEI